MFISDTMHSTYRLERSHMWQPWKPGHIKDGDSLWDELRKHGAQVMYHRAGFDPEVYTYDANYWPDGTGRWVNGDVLF